MHHVAFAHTNALLACIAAMYKQLMGFYGVCFPTGVYTCSMKDLLLVSGIKPPVIVFLCWQVWHIIMYVTMCYINIIFCCYNPMIDGYYTSTVKLAKLTYLINQLLLIN